MGEGASKQVDEQVKRNLHASYGSGSIDLACAHLLWFVHGLAVIESLGHSDPLPFLWAVHLKPYTINSVAIPWGCPYENFVKLCTNVIPRDNTM